MKNVLIFTAGLAAAITGCTPRSDVCYQLTQELRACGLMVTDPQCGEIGVEAETALLDAMADGCASPEIIEDGAYSEDLCRFAGWSCPGPIGAEPGRDATRHTMLFVGGIDDTPAFDWSPRIIDAVSDVHDAHHVPLSSFGSVEQRSRDLASAIDSLAAGRPERRFNLVCYAVGGRECRYLVSPGGLFRDDPTALAAIQARVASITTISTPHHGTRLAEAAALALMHERDTAVLSAFGLERFDGTGSETPYAIVSELMTLTPYSSLAFNEQVVDAPNIYYQSYAAVSDLPLADHDDDDEIARLCGGEGASLYGDVAQRDVLNPLLWLPSAFAHESFDGKGSARTGPADGQVAVYSAMWGNFRGCLSADHWDVVGQIANVARDPNTGFDAPRFYLQLATELFEMGL